MMEQPAVRPIGVEDVTDYHPVRGTIRAKRVNFRHTDGTTSYIVVPYDEYNAQTITERLQAEAEKHAAVMAVKVTPGTTPYPMQDDTGNPWG